MSKQLSPTSRRGVVIDKTIFNVYFFLALLNTVGSRYPEIWGLSGNFPDSEIPNYEHCEH